MLPFKVISKLPSRYLQWNLPVPLGVEDQLAVSCTLLSFSGHWPFPFLGCLLNSQLPAACCPISVMQYHCDWNLLSYSSGFHWRGGDCTQYGGFRLCWLDRCWICGGNSFPPLFAPTFLPAALLLQEMFILVCFASCRPECMSTKWNILISWWIRVGCRI